MGKIINRFERLCKKCCARFETHPSEDKKFCSVNCYQSYPRDAETKYQEMLKRQDFCKNCGIFGEKNIEYPFLCTPCANLIMINYEEEVENKYI